MPTNTQTLENMRDRAKKMAGLRDSDYLSDAEWNDLLNSGLAELHRLIILAKQYYYETIETIAIVAGTEAYNLPAAFCHPYRVKVLHQARRVTIDPWTEIEDGRASRYAPNIVSPPPGSLLHLRWRIVADQILLRGLDDKAPAQAGTAYLYYAPRHTRLTDDEGTPPVNEGDEEYAVVWAAMTANDSRKFPIDHLERRLARLEASIKSVLGPRQSQRTVGMTRRR